MEARAILRNCPSSPRKMRLVADMIRGKKAGEAQQILKFSKKDAAYDMEKLLRSAISNWENKSEIGIEDVELFITEVKVDGDRMLKRLRPAPQGRGYRIRKRSNHITIVVGSKGGELDMNIQETNNDNE